MEYTKLEHCYRTLGERLTNLLVYVAESDSCLAADRKVAKETLGAKEE